MSAGGKASRRRGQPPPPDPPAYAAARALADAAREPARWDQVLLGTAGWTDPTLVQGDRFYPSGLRSARERLAHYARHFSLVEVDATYYSLLPPENAQRWLEATGEGFRFDVKAHPVFTKHPIDVTRLPNDLRATIEAWGGGNRVYADRLPGDVVGEMEQRFLSLVQPLATAGRLGCVMLQFPPWFQATRGNARHLERLRQRLGDLPCSVEFRHPSWLVPERRERVFDLLRGQRLSYVVVDEPDVQGGGVPPVEAVTHEALALLRLHGQNLAGWRRGTSVRERFDYVYAPAELEQWVQPVRHLRDRAREVHAIFNNCVRDYAVLGAKGLSVLLGRRETG